MKKILIIGLALFSAIAANAQNETPAIRWTNYTPNSFWSNWEISAGVGAGTFARIENPTNPRFKDMPHISFNLAVSKWFNPIIGGRLQFQAATKVTVELKNGKLQNFSYGYAHYDQLVDVTNWICGYKPDRFYSAVAFVGAGLSINPGKDFNKEFAASAGLQNRFRLCESWNLDLEIAAMVVRGDFNSGKITWNVAGVASDVNVSIGATYKFPVRGWQPANQNKVDDGCAKRTSDLEKDNNNYKKALKDANDDNSRLKKELENARKTGQNQPQGNKPAANTTSNYEQVAFTIFFGAGDANLSDEANVTLKTIIELLNKADESETYTITGYADKDTGSAKGNMDLSKKRAEVVRKALVKGGIAESRLKTDARGDTVQPLGSGSINRCVIIKKDN